MAVSDDYLLRLSRKFNRTQVGLFTARGAAKHFLGRIGLSSRKFPPSTFGSDTTRLAPTAEKRYFEVLHFIKYQIYRSIRSGDFQSIQFWISYYTPIRNRIVCANYGLIPFCAKRTSISCERDSLISQAQLILIEAADDFDPWINIKFSTFACRAILRGFGRLAQPFISSAADPASLPYVDGSDRDGIYEERLQAILTKNSARLTKIEETVVKRRFGIGDSPATLEHLGRTYGVTKERIRQIQVAALKKLKRSLADDPFLQ